MPWLFLAAQAAEAISKTVTSFYDLLEADREELLAFLSRAPKAEYVPQSGGITGILKEMKNAMVKGRAAAATEEEKAIKSLEGLMSAKTKEVNGLSAAVEKEKVRSDEIGMRLCR